MTVDEPQKSLEQLDRRLRTRASPPVTTRSSTLLRMRCYWVRQWASAMHYNTLTHTDENTPPTCLWCALWC